MYERYSESARLSFVFATQEALGSGCMVMEPRHLLIGMLQAGHNAVVDALESIGALQSLKAELGVTQQFAFLRQVRQMQEVRLLKDNALKQINEQAILEARMSGHEFVTTAHLVLAMLRAETGKVPPLAGLTYDQFRSAAIPRLATTGGDPERHPEFPKL